MSSQEPTTSNSNFGGSRPASAHRRLHRRRVDIQRSIAKVDRAGEAEFEAVALHPRAILDLRHTLCNAQTEADPVEPRAAVTDVLGDA